MFKRIFRSPLFRFHLTYVSLSLVALTLFCVCPSSSASLGRVSEVKWIRTVRIDRWTSVVIRDWKDGVVERDELVGITPGMRLAVPAQCAVEPYDDTQDKIRCDYVTQAWKFVRFLTASGVDKNPQYPPYEARPNERSKLTEHYMIEVEVGKEKLRTSITAADFARWETGDAVWVEKGSAIGDIRLKPVGGSHGP